MIDMKLLRENPKPYEEATKAKNISVDFSKLLELDKEVREIKQEQETLKAEQNSVSKDIPNLQGEEKEKVLGDMKVLADKVKELTAVLNEKESTLQEMLLAVSNPLDPTTPIGKDDTENEVLRFEGEKPKFDFEAKEHWELGEALDLLDLERSAKVSGSRFYYIKGNLVLLHRALQQYTLDIVMKHGFTPVLPPVLVREDAMYGTGFFPADRNEIYTVNAEEDQLFLIGTSEVPLMSYHSGEILEGPLPKRYVGISPCFRREAGTYGKDTKGIIRVHQFEKVEMVSLVPAEDSQAEHDLILSIEEEILQGLKIPYQVVNICSGDLGLPAAKKYDIEAWMPGQGKYREVTSTSNCTDFQTRRLQIRHKKDDGSKEFLHGLNGTGTSMRPLIAIMENYQQADGSIVVPEVLRPYMGGLETL